SQAPQGLMGLLRNGEPSVPSETEGSESSSRYRTSLPQRVRMATPGAGATLVWEECPQPLQK
ncbi:hypothetical protein P7K49_015352, partial [Saguinus oedipus]